MTEDSIRVSPGRPVSGRPNADVNHLPLDLLVAALIALAVLIAAAVDDGFGASRAWLYVTIIGSALIVSRGLRHQGHGH